MNWYYRKKTSSRQKGIISREQLDSMIKSGGIDKADLLYSDETKQKWVRAGSVPDLFPPDPAPVKAKPAPAPSPAPQPQPAPAKRQALPLARLAITVAVVSLGIFIILNRNSEEIDDRPPELPAQEYETPEEPIDAAIVLENEITAFLRNADFIKAQDSLNNYISEHGTNELSNRLSTQLYLRREQEAFRKLYSLFRTYKTTDGEIQSMVNLASRLGETDKLTDALRGLLNSTPPPSANACKSILTAARILNDLKLQLSALHKLGSAADYSSSISECLHLANLYTQYNMPEEAISLLEEFTKANPDSGTAWLELAARLSIQNNVNASLDALKKAVRTGGDAARMSAREDPRFDNVRDTWTFRRNTK